MTDTIDVLIVGFGAVGVLYGWVLSQNANVRVTALARSSFDAMKDGITLESEKYGRIEGWKPYRLVKDPHEANDRAYQYIICATKALPDLLPTASILAPFLESQYHNTVDEADLPTVVLLQNGIGTEHPLAAAYPHIPIISVSVWVGANLKDGGLVTHGTLEKLVMGLYDGEGGRTGTDADHTDDPLIDPHGYRQGKEGEERYQEGQRRTKVFADLINNGGGTAELVEDIQVARYQKNLWNAAFSSVCAMSRSPVSQVVAPAVLPYTLPYVRRMMLEVVYVARAMGYQEDVLPLKSVDDTIAMTIRTYQAKSPGVPPTPFTPGFTSNSYEFPTEGSPVQDGIETSVAFKPSLLLDLEAGRPCEVEVLIGSLLDRARAKGVATPRLDGAYSMLKIHQDQAVKSYAESRDYQQHIESWLSKPPSVGGLGAHGRKAWEKAMRGAGLPRFEKGSVGMAGGKDKIPGKPVHAIPGTDFA
ncbi:hypothetical protein JCM10213_008857 [Rhodosporidiobolus nylandii]